MPPAAAVLDGALDAFTWNDSKKDQCINALDGYKSLMDGPTVESTTT